MAVAKQPIWPAAWRQTTPAALHDNFGAALQRLGERESGTQHAGEAVAAYRAAREIFTMDVASHHPGTTQRNLARGLALLAEWRGCVDVAKFVRSVRCEAPAPDA
jgi:hypothetical protein